MKHNIFALVSLALTLGVVRGQKSPVTLKACGTVIPPPAEMAAQEQNFQALLKSNPPPERLADVVIPVYYHIVYANQTLEGGYLSDQNARDTFNMLNTGFQNSGFTFQLEEIRRYNNPTWFNEIGVSDPCLRRASVEGFAQYPWNYANNPDSDGVTLRHTIFPGNGNPKRFGKTYIHEVGHWLGLYHTFEGHDCSGSGDFVSDTPAQAFQADGCPIGLDSCPFHPGVDPISNYMDYTEDLCRTEFTPGQIARMSGQYNQYRA
ncbi:hypothetical protein FA15DRAFT_704739 [Coprinopsis marcescibilis]|uniref:Peptidase M43 pregnancy-associated plasma-A domain-containing protein n=1 Tax=Coprinopsis marcescibilis TaxID=230819 RepID=A0A5C3KVR3_COPMA|nr:hypothetical protein FA15DRAFT_704739 [Coprinopsis marcescibilis]